MIAGRRVLGPVSGGGGPAVTWEPNAVSFVNPCAFLVTGADRTGTYKAGTVAFVPATNSWSSVWASSYAAGNTTVILNEAICVSGMPSVGFIPLKMNLNLSLFTGGTAFSSGYDTFPEAGAFDGNVGTYWSSLQRGTGQNGVSFIAYHTATPFIPNWVKVSQWATTNAMPTVLLQYYTNDSYPVSGGAWTTLTTLTLNTAGAWMILLGLPVCTAHCDWRILAQADLGGTYNWVVNEFQMGA